jgi:hypothetical protein
MRMNRDEHLSWKKIEKMHSFMMIYKLLIKEIFLNLVVAQFFIMKIFTLTQGNGQNNIISIGL